MKQLFTLSIVFLFATSAWAQNLVLDEDSLYAEGPSAGTIGHYTDLTNQTSQSLNLKWQRTVNSLPAGWGNAFCIGTLCYSETTSSGTFSDPLPAGATSDISGYFYLDNATAAGVGHAQIVIWDPLDSINTHAVLNLFYNSWPVGIDNAETADNAAPAIYPNPATHQVQLDNVEPFDLYKVYDLNGRLLLTGRTDEQVVNISSLAKGSYILQLEGRDASYQELLQKQ